MATRPYSSRLRGPLAIALIVAIASPLRAQTESTPPAPAESQPSEAITPPRLVRAEEPVYPPDRVADGGHPAVGFLVVIDATGAIRSAEVEHSAGAEFDEAARVALMRWVFEPARRGDVAIASRIRVSVHFELPTIDLPTATIEPDDVDEAHAAHAAEAARSDAPPAPEPAPASDDDSLDVGDDVPEAGASATVDAAELRAVDRTASEVHVDRATLAIAPHRDAGQMLATAPGLVVTRPEGDAVAHRILLRGFDAEHGQDIELTLEGLPLNQPSHLHGQGYADLNFIVPEVVRGIRVREGVYDPSQGDFAVAGSADFELGVSRRGITAIAQMGSFRTFREALIIAPENEDDDTFVAFETRRSDGFGEHRSALSASSLAQWGFDAGSWRFRLLGALAGSRADTAGVVRRDDVDDVGFYGVYDDASARAQNAFAARALVALRGERRGARDQTTDLAVFLGFTDFRSQTNFTGYTEVSQFDPTWRGRGDLVEQRNQASTVGLRFRHRGARFAPFSWLSGTLEVGASARLDRTEQSQSLLEMPQNETWDRRIDARIVGSDVGVFVDVDLDLGDLVSLRAGARADALFYDVDDSLGNFIPAYRRDDYIVGYRRTAFGVAAGPRVSLDVHPIEGLSFLAAYGEGYRSPQAISLEDGERAPFTKVRSADLGVRFAHRRDDFDLALTGSAFLTRLSDDLVFEPTENRYERIGRSSRVGGMIAARFEGWETLLASVSATFVKATLLDPPAATAEDPDPPFRRGSLLPYVPPVVVRADVGAHRSLGELGGDAIVGSIGVGVSFVGSRPLPQSQRASAYTLLDAQAEVAWKALRLGVSAQNLLGTRWAASEYFFASNWDPESVGSRISTRHIAAGTPRTLLFTISVTP